MKGIGFLLFILLSIVKVGAQNFSCSDLLQLQQTSPRQLQQALARKGYQQQYADSRLDVFKNTNDSTDTNTLTRKLYPYATLFTLEHLERAAFAQWHNELVQAGFLPLPPGINNAKRYSKAFTTVSFEPNSKTPATYTVTLEHRRAAKQKEMIYAEDLFACNSHQQLELVFGKKAVVQDIFLDPYGKQVPCSVLYPNTAREVVFLWKDPLNLYGLQQARIGGNRHTVNALQQARSVAQSNWVSRQGVYAGMPIQLLERYNRQPISFCNNEGNICPDNNGRINFRLLNIEPGCLYCPDAHQNNAPQFAISRNTTESTRMFVATLILFPLDPSSTY